MRKEKVIAKKLLEKVTVEIERKMEEESLHGRVAVREQDME